MPAFLDDLRSLFQTQPAAPAPAQPAAPSAGALPLPPTRSEQPDPSGSVQPEAAIEPRLLTVQCITSAGLHRIAYKEWGDPANPDVLICAHGLTRASGDFDDLARAMAPHFRVACPDVAGRGRSDWLRDPMLYQVPMYVGDMVTLLARLNANTVRWFGTSMGGLIGMGLASLPGNPIMRLVLNDVGPILSGAGIARIGEYLSKPIRFKTFEEAEQYIRLISLPFGPHSDAQWRHITEVVIKQDGDEWITHYDPAIAIPFKAAANANPDGADTVLWPVYDAIQCPTLSVRGEYSDLLTPATQQEMATRGPKAKLVTIPGVGHAPTFMHPEQIAIAKEFLLRP